jgi:hypothetical protein
MPGRISAAVLAKFIVPAAILGAHWFVDAARPFHNATRLADFAIDFGLAVYIAAVVRGRGRDAMVGVASILFCMAVAEGYALSVLAASATHVQTPGHYVFDPVMGWRAGHPGVFHHTELDAKTGQVIFDVDSTIDRNLNRQVLSAEDGPTVAFFGDSFTFGEGLRDEDTLPQIFADLTGRRMHVLNLAGTGYGPQQFLRPLETGLFDNLLTEPRVFVFQTAPWHADRAACVSEFIMPAARYTMSDGQPKYRGRCADRWWPWLNTLFTLSMYRIYLQPMVLGASPAKLDLYIAILIRAGEIAREKYHVPTVILYIPDAAYLRGSGSSDEQIMQRLRDGGLTVIDGRLDQSAFPGQNLAIPGDGHPTGIANRARAVLLRDAIAALDAQSR